MDIWGMLSSVLVRASLALKVGEGRQNCRPPEHQSPSRGGVMSGRLPPHWPSNASFAPWQGSVASGALAERGPGAP